MISAHSSSRRWLTHLCIALAFILYMASADFVFERVLTVENESHLMEMELPKESGGTIKFGIDDISNTKIMWKDLGKIKGWAFVAGESARNNKTFMLLTSGNHAYIFDSFTDLRGDLPRTFNESDLFLENAGFISFFAKGLMEDGIYRLGICIKNDSGMHLLYTPQYLTKEKQKIYRGFLSREKSVPLIPETDGILTSIEVINSSIERGEDATEIKGWAFIDGIDATGNCIYVVLKSEHRIYFFDTVLYKRKEVTQYFHYKGFNFDHSGFTSHVPQKSVEKGIYRIGIYIETPDRKELKFTDKTLVF